jgi:D-alanyl-D-alanine carboxypeptidase (penicillin-binding protein 5/6)
LLRAARSFALLLALGTGVAQGAGAPVADRYPRAASAYVVEIGDAVRWARAAEERLPPASLTKLMTAIVLLESRWEPDALVTVSARAARATGARAGLAAREQLTAGSLLAALLVRSANDACIALAEFHSGTIERFVARMNERAAALALTGTHFVNPCGLDAPGHLSTANDLLRLAHYAAKYPSVAALATARELVIETRAGRKITLQTTNPLLGRLDGVVGLKSGYTAQAGRCAIVHARRDGIDVWIVLLNARDRWWTAAALVEDAFHGARRP